MTVGPKWLGYSSYEPPVEIIRPIPARKGRGFVVQGGRIQETATYYAAGRRTSIIGGWMLSFAKACGWASLIAAGTLVYTYAVRRWGDEGYPIIPINALGVQQPPQGRPHHQQQPQGYSEPVRVSYSSRPAPSSAQRPAILDVLEEYDG